MPSRHATIASPIGLHARPATLFTQQVVTSGFQISIGRPGGRPVNAASVLAVMALGIKCGEEVVLSSDDPSAAESLDDLVVFLETHHDVTATYSSFR